MTRSLDQALISAADVSAMATMNLAVNGFHTISQENGSNAVTASGSYPTDQWLFTTGGGSSVITSQRVSSPFPSVPAIKFGLKATVTTAAAQANSDYFRWVQQIEGNRWARLGFGAANAIPVTVAFMARSSINLTGYVHIIGSAQNRTFLRRFTLQANTDQLVTVTIPGDITGTWTNDVAFGALLGVCFGAGSSLCDTADTWRPSGAIAGSDVTPFQATAGATVVMSGVVALPGIVPISATMLPLLARHVDDELRLCQRYWRPFSFDRTNSSATTSGYVGGTFTLPVPMRVNPGLVYNDGAGNTTKFVTSNGSNIASTGGGVYPYADRVFVDAILAANPGNWWGIFGTLNARM